MYCLRLAGIYRWHLCFKQYTWMLFSFHFRASGRSVAWRSISHIHSMSWSKYILGRNWPSVPVHYLCPLTSLGNIPLSFQSPLWSDEWDWFSLLHDCHPHFLNRASWILHAYFSCIPTSPLHNDPKFIFLESVDRTEPRIDPTLHFSLFPLFSSINLRPLTPHTIARIHRPLPPHLHILALL